MSEFLPLLAPRVESTKAKPAEPITWYKVVAPQFPASPSAESANGPDTETGGHSEIRRDAGTDRAMFGSIDAIAENERRRARAAEPEPEDIRERRRAAAEEAAQLVAEARAQATEILAESREQGYAAGYAAGHADGENAAIRQVTQRADDDWQRCSQDLTAFMATIESNSRQAWLDMEPEILGLVFEIARKVIKMEVELNRDAAVSVVKNTLRRVADSTSLRIRVHADDLQTIRDNRDELYTLVDAIRQVEIVEDRRVGPGGCIVETNAGTIDARIETQLEEIRKLLEQATIEAS